MAVMMYNHTDRKGKAGSTGTGITELSHDLLSFTGVLGPFVAAVPELRLGACCKMMVFILIRIILKINSLMQRESCEGHVGVYSQSVLS